MANVLIALEQTDGKIKKGSYAAITFGQQVVRKSGGELYLLLMGDRDLAGATAEIRRLGARAIWTIENPSFAHFNGEHCAQTLLAAAEACDARLIAATTSSAMKEALARVAARLQAGMASDVIAVIDEKTFARPMWAGNVTATVEITTPHKICSVRATEFGQPQRKPEESPVKPLAVRLANAPLSRFVSFKAISHQRPEVTTAARVVAGGRGVKGAEGFQLIEQLADAMGAAVGASRAACDAGWAPSDAQIGQTGKVVAPDLYFAIGISGAIQHLAGIKGSKTIVAINRDAEAPIFQIADYGLVADLFQAVPQLIEKLKAAS